MIPDIIQNRPGEGMLGLCLQRSGNGKKGLRISLGEDVRHLRLAGGQRTGLVHHNGVHMMQVFKGLGILEQHTHFGSLSGTHHNGNGCSQTKGAGAADDQHRNGGGQREFQGLSRQHPRSKGRCSNGHDNGNKNTGDFIRQPGNGGLGAARLLHHADHLGQGSILPHLFRPEFQISGDVDGGSRHRIPGLLLHGNTFTGQGALINGSTALDHGAVHGDPAAGFNKDDVPHPHLFGGNLQLRALPAYQSRFRRQVHQLPDGISGLTLGPSLQEFAQGDEGQNHGSGFKIEVFAVKLHHIPLSVTQRIAHTQQGENTVDQRSAGAHRNQRIHIGRFVPQGLQTPAVVHPVQIHRRQRQEKLHQRKQQRVLQPVKNMGCGQPHHMPHGQIHQDHKENTGADDPLFHLPQRVVFDIFFLGRRCLLPRRGCAVARL